MIYTHRIIGIKTGTRPSELRFESREAAEKWLQNYQVSQQYKDENYRIVLNVSDREQKRLFA